MTSIILPGDISQPRVVTFAELVATVTPVLLSWGMADYEIILELHDLWKLGAPGPNTGPDTKPDHEQRVLIHTQFNKWWREAMARAGMTITPRQVFAPRG